jgi:D-alanine--D-alanine ligase
MLSVWQSLRFSSVSLFDDFFMKVGIFFGGRSREREVSFAGGRTVYDNLNKSIFTPVPIFVDSIGNFILLNWQNIYKGSISDFYPAHQLCDDSDFKIYIESLSFLPASELKKHISAIGSAVYPHQFAELFDFAFLALHGLYGEDGSIQGLLEWYNIPYSGTSILGSAIGLDKSFQTSMIQAYGYNAIKHTAISREEWLTYDQLTTINEAMKDLGDLIVVKSACQGSSIGVSVANKLDIDAVVKAVNKAFFIEEVSYVFWRSMSPEDINRWLSSLIDISTGIGFPILIEGTIFYSPKDLSNFITAHFSTKLTPLDLHSIYGESTALLEPYIEGREFSCIVLQGDDNVPVALPPTEMIKMDAMLNYRDKYLPGAVNKQTPIDLTKDQMNQLTELCCKIFSTLKFQVYARIDGIISKDFKIFINDPNTTVGMTPSSFLFHQAAEIGLNPSQLITFIIRNSLAARLRENKYTLKCKQLLDYVDKCI